ncbi:hypothetical protein Acor_80350 [Acrocarpospora corrugata]|uniref:Uncharacterized protein n=1 Tax=Acrocarpospora corrugata TaxID=35763 RepID=A0A5M3WAY2_9ACTN|nr:hypothetical protein [Acrocarpospora corrugata]GES05966.1 hypothetical protein Acor_80350 [Acrocarpospora corrugata]
MNPTEYAQAVRDALADLPAADLEELVEDLDDHLAEVAAESDVPLEERLGSPETYAAELRAAYGGRPEETLVTRLGVRARLGSWTAGTASRAHTRMSRFPPYRQAAGFIPDLRPAWWVLRGYALALLLVSISTMTTQFVPESIGAWLFTLAGIWASVWIGRRAGRTGWRRLLLVSVDVLAGVLVVAGMVAVAEWNGQEDNRVHYAGEFPIARMADVGGEVYNIFPYAKDGTPLRDVRLYDQDGRPITLNPEVMGWVIDQNCRDEPPLGNEYPLPLKRDPAIRVWRLENGEIAIPTPELVACATPNPAPTPAPTSAPTETGTATLTPTETGTLTPTPTATGKPTPTTSPSGD